MKCEGEPIWVEQPSLVPVGRLTSKQTHVRLRAGCTIPVAKTRLITASGKVELHVYASAPPTRALISD
jgi:hypothetical protein